MMEAPANFAGVLIAGWLLGLEIWVVGIAVLAWVIARPGPITPRTVAAAGLLLGASAAVYVAAVLLIGCLLSPGR